MSAANEAALAHALLESLDVAVLRRVGPREYVFFGNMPRFYAELFRCSPGKPETRPWEHSDMLQFFLDDAEAFFERGSGTFLSTGVWQEDGVEADKALTAMAVVAREERFLLLRRLSDEFVDRVRILQQAREHLLERRMLSNDLELYKQKSMIDPLTSLHNREAFMDALTRAMRHTRETGAPFSLLFLDIDDFKQINDTYGHLSGDSVLSTLGRIFRAYLRREDMAARYGGEEFAVLAPLSTRVQAHRMAEKLRKRIAGHSFPSLPMITVSIGCTGLVPGDSPEALIQRADLALYDAKRAGKNCVRFR